MGIRVTELKSIKTLQVNSSVQELNDQVSEFLQQVFRSENTPKKTLKVLKQEPKNMKKEIRKRKKLESVVTQEIQVLQNLDLIGTSRRTTNENFGHRTINLK